MLGRLGRTWNAESHAETKQARKVVAANPSAWMKTGTRLRTQWARTAAKTAKTHVLEAHLRENVLELLSSDQRHESFDAQA